MPNDSTQESGLPTFPFPRTDPFGPPPEYARLRAEEPISKVTLFNGAKAWLITRYEDACRLLADPRISSVQSAEGYPVITPNEVALLGITTFVSMDPPEHTAHRRLLIPEFTVKRVRELRPAIQQTVDDLIDRMIAQGPPVDLVPALSLALPALVICQILGVPYADREFFHTRTHLMVRGSTAEETGAAAAELMEYVRTLVADKRKNPTDDLLGRLLKNAAKPGASDGDTPRLSEDDVVNIAMLLLGAGYETTANMLTLGVLTLLRRPDDRAALCAEPELFPSAVQELLRWLSIADTATRRVVKADIELDGHVLRAGEGVIVANAAANRDDRMFPDADRLDIRRDARQHLAFGYGPHQCLGQHLGAAELEIALSTLFRRLPSLRLAVPLEELPTQDAIALCAVTELPVAW